MKIALMLTVVGSLIVAPLVYAQPEALKIGIAQWGDNAEYERNIQGFKDGLAEAGFKDGGNVVYKVENSSAQLDQQILIVEGFVEDQVDLIYTLTTPGTLAAKSVTKDIPIVFSIVTYPIEAGIIDSLISSKNNLVGTRNYISPAEQYYYFEKVYPAAKTLAFVHRKGESNSKIQLKEFETYLSKRKISTIDIAAIDQEDIRQQLESRKDEYDVLFLACDTLIQSGGAAVVLEVSKKYKKPSFSCVGDGVQKGSLIGAVAELYEIGKMSGQKAALILDGTKPANINTETAKESYIMVNMNAAHSLGLTVPKDILDKASVVIDGRGN